MHDNFSVVDLRVDGLPSGTCFCASETPSLGWRMECSRIGAQQAAYRIVARDGDGNLLWDSGKVPSPEAASVLWNAAPLASRTHVLWQVTVWDEIGNSAVSSEAKFETPLFHNDDWLGRWIHYDGNNSSAPAPCPYFRSEFKTGKVRRARLYIACRGVMVPYINGKRIGQDRMAPGWTEFASRVQYMTYDVTDFLQEGRNALGVIVGDGWYCSYTTGRVRTNYGPYPELLAQLEITDCRGRVKSVVTNRRWRVSTGPILYSDIYDGEAYDARLEMPGWNTVGFDCSQWKNASEGENGAESTPLVPKCCLPVRCMMEVKPVALLHPRPDTWIWDLGQNLAGVVRIRNLRGYRGGLFTIRFGEMLYDDGTLYTLNYRSAKSTDYYTCATGLEEPCEYEPMFTFHGFRYVQIDGFQFMGNGKAEDLDVTAVVMHSELEATGGFECGVPKLNRLYQNVLWGQRSNFLEIPTDCPQRDERLGWTGDAEVFCGTAALNMNVEAFFRKYLTDMRDAQLLNGSVTNVAPDVIHCGDGVPAWADAAVICPWKIYMAYGDKRILEENFGMMCKWLDFQERESNSYISTQNGFGDWLALSVLETPQDLIGTAYFAHTASLLSRIAKILGRERECEHYGEMAEKVRLAFQRQFLDGDGIVSPATQTSLALALHFSLLPEAKVQANAKRLQERIHANGDRLDTGFVGTACLNMALSENGLADLAHALYMQEEYPSWLFSVNQGATTMWERWNSYTKVDGFGDVAMNSFNHYAYGAVHEWVVTHLCGIGFSSPGGRCLRFKAEPEPRLGYARASISTRYGLVQSYWRFADDRTVTWELSAPPNTEMEVLCPDGWTSEQAMGKVPCGKYTFTLHR